MSQDIVKIITANTIRNGCTLVKNNRLTTETLPCPDTPGIITDKLDGRLDLVRAYVGGLAAFAIECDFNDDFNGDFCQP